MDWERDASRISPYPPNFRRIAAKIIDPATGASTWALGNQRCREYKGIFVKKARIVAVHHKIQRFGVLHR